MAPKYKLTYLPVQGLAEPIRFLLSYLGEDFEDFRMDWKDVPSLKTTTPFGKVPVLEVEGKVLTQSVAICRYLGTQAGLAGQDDWENVNIDIIADTITDILQPIRGFFGMAAANTSEEVKKALKETYLTETLPFYMKKLDAVVEENGGYLANKKLSWVDLQFTAMLGLLSGVAEVDDVTAPYPHLQALRSRVLALPQIKAWVDKRPADRRPDMAAPQQSQK